MSIDTGPSKGFLEKIKMNKSKKKFDGKKDKGKSASKGKSRLAEVFKNMH